MDVIANFVKRGQEAQTDKTLVRRTIPEAYVIEPKIAKHRGPFMHASTSVEEQMCFIRGGDRKPDGESIVPSISRATFDSYRKSRKVREKKYHKLMESLQALFEEAKVI